MKKTSRLPLFFPASAAVVCVLLALLWTSFSRTSQFASRKPGLDGTPEKSSVLDARPLVASAPVVGPGVAAQIGDVWSGFRGSNHDAISSSETPLARSWTADGPPVLWQIDVEEGYAGAAIQAGKAYLLDYDVVTRADTLRCLSIDDGREIWRSSYPTEISPNHGITRTIPAIEDKFVVTIGPRCDVACWDSETGENRWLFSMVERYGSEERQWYSGQCPLIDNGRVILAPCGDDALLVCLDLASGEEIWRTPNPRSWKMTHSSIMPIEFVADSPSDNDRMYVYCGTGGTAGVRPSDGTLLWDETSWDEHFATSPSPLGLPGNQIFLSSGYDRIGAMFLNLEKKDGQFAAVAGEKLDRKEFNSEQQTPVLYKNHLFGVRKHRGGQFVCLDLAGKERWNSGRDKMGHGPYMIADDLILTMSDNGRLVAVEATPDAYRPLWEKQVFENGNEAWGPMAIADGRLIVRDLTRMACVDLRNP